MGTPFSIASYERDALIFSQGDPCDSVMHIEKGRVRLTVTAGSGNEAICAVLGPGAFLGDEALAGHAVRRQGATAMTATEVLALPKAQMVRLLHTQPEFADRFIAHTLARNARLEVALTDLLLNSAEQRLARILLVLAGCDETRPCRCVVPHVSQGVLAEMIGTTRSRVNFFIGKFKKRGWVDDEGGVLHVGPSLRHALRDKPLRESLQKPQLLLDHFG